MIDFDWRNAFVVLAWVVFVVGLLAATVLLVCKCVAASIIAVVVACCGAFVGGGLM